MRLIFSGLIILIFWLSSCVKDNKAERTPVQVHVAPVIHLERYKADDGILTGKVLIYEGNSTVYFELNWESRSKVSLEVTGSLKDQVGRMNGKIIHVKGPVVKKSEWNGTIEVQEIVTNK